MQPYLGEIRLLPFGFAPVGWQDCDGSLLSIAENDALFVLLGTNYGGDGVSTFAVPDLRGRLPVHRGTGRALSPYVLGQKTGSEAVTLITANLPAHTHAVQATNAPASTGAPTTGTAELATISGDTMYTSDITGLTVHPAAASMLTTVGGSQAHDNTMPTLAVRFCIALAGVFPSQS
jgi:microcystin-dependent protein